MKLTWPTKKLGEINCAKNFLKNFNIQFKESEIKANLKEDDVIDVLFGNKKFQVIHADFEFQRKINTVPSGTMVEFSNTPQSTWRKFIIDPLKKKNKYGKVAKGIILLIDSYTEPPWIEKWVDTFKESSLNLNYLKKLGFDEIYLVCPNKNIKVYP